MKRLRVGLIGAGLIAQVMHLHYLRELADRFQVEGIADIVPANAESVARRHGIPNAYADWHELLEQPLDVVLVLTGGSHAPMAIEAAKRGIHLLVEKPMCYTVAEGLAMVETARANGVVLMVGYQKRYDPAYMRYRDEIAALADPRLHAHNYLGVAVLAVRRALRHHPAAEAGGGSARRATGGIARAG